MVSIISTLLMLACSLFGCLFWVVLIGGGVYFVFLRGDSTAADEPAPKAIEKPAPQVPAAAPKTPEPVKSGIDHDEDEDDAKTVVARAPVGLKDPGDAPKPPPRVSGATIIAFDDDDDLL